MTPGEQVTLQPAFERMLGEQLHDASVLGKLTAVLILRIVLGQPGLLTGLIDGLQLVMVDKNNPEIYQKMDGDDEADEARYGLVGCYSFVGQIRQSQKIRKAPSHLERLLKGEYADSGTGGKEWYNL